ncbi:MAG: insulinase family protein [Proteobacteria bacterium]|nr:insulinase family protein [Pseudomonadota bacterium]
MVKIPRISLTLLLAFTGALASHSAAADPVSSDSIIPFPVHQKRLPNGLQVVVVPMQSNGLAAHWIVVRTGSRDEYEPGRTGFAHFFEHMMFYGTKKYPRSTYEELVTRMGADSNAFTSNDITVYFLNVATEDLDQVMAIESDRFKNLSYSQQGFQTEAGAVYGEYRKSRTSPFFALYEAMSTTAFQRHTYGHTVIGFEKDIKAMPTMFDYSRTFFARYYRPDNAILVVAGDIAADRVFAQAEKHYGDWKPGYVPPKVEPEPEQTAERRVDVAYPGRSLPMIWAGYKCGRFDPGDRIYAASFVLAELAFGETSDIYRRLVLEEQVLQSIDADPADSRDPGLWLVRAVVKDSAKIDSVMAEIDRTVVRYRDMPPEAERVAAVKSHMRYSFVMRLDSPPHVAGRIARLVGTAGSVEAIEQMYRTLDAVTPADIQAAAKKYLVAERRTVAILRGKE